MASQEDCYFFFNSTCTKGDDCPFRHERVALANSLVCEHWKNGSCERNPCHLRHGPMAEMPRSIPCYYDQQPSGCLNFNCNFLHRKPRPFQPDHQFNNATHPRPIPAAQPRLNTPFPPPIFVHPQNVQRFRAPHQHQVDFSPRKMPTAPHQQRFPPPQQRFPPPRMRPAVFPHPPRELVPNMNIPGGMRHPRLFQDGDIVNGMVAGEKPFEPRAPDMITELTRAAMTRSLQPAMLTNVRMMSNPIVQLNDRPGLLGDHPVLPFPFGGILPFNIPAVIAQQNNSRSSEVKHSSKRTVKKIDKRHGKSSKVFKQHGERRISQDSDDIKRKRKDKRSSSRDLKGTTNKQRKVKKDGVLSRKKDRRVGSTSPKDDENDFKEIDKEIIDEAKLPFKVKSLEEILRDKALKKLYERQQMQETPGGGGENAGTGITAEKPAVSNMEVGSLTNDITENTDNIASQLKPKQIPPLRIEAKEKLLQNKTTPGVKIREVVLISGGGNVVESGKNDKQNSKVINYNLSTVKVKTLNEIKRSKLKKLGETKMASEPELKIVDSDVKKSIHRKLKPLKPLRNTGRYRKLGMNGGHKGAIGSGGTSSNVTSDEDQKKPLPAITLITDNRENTLKLNAKILSERRLKRKRVAQVGLQQQITPSKVQKLTSKSGFVGAVIQKTLGKVESGNVSVCSKEREVSPSVESKEKDVTECRNVESRLAPSDTLKESGKPVRKIKLKRLGLMSKTVNEEQGKTRILQSALGRRIKLNSNKRSKVNEDVVPIPSPECVKLDSRQQNTNTDTPVEIRIKEEQAMKSNQIPTNTAHSTTVTKEGNLFSAIASEDVKSRALENTESDSSVENKSKVSKLSKTPITVVECARNEGPSETMEQRLLSGKTFLKSSLDKLVKEVSDDIKEEDLLDEDLEKAIAELSPVLTDDEDEISNADDLLLEIEEMINS